MSNKSPAGSFSMLYFAAAATYTQKPTEYLTAPLPISELFDTLESKYPGMKQRVLTSCAVTVNLDYVDVEEDGRASDLMINEGDEVAIIPPVSSG